LWDLSFVDPDNRRQVNFAKQSQLLDDLKRRETEDRRELLRDLLKNWHDGRIKFYLTYKLTNFRRAYPEIMLDGAYLPLDVSGELGDKVCAFARRSGSAWAVAVTPRLIGAAVFNGAVPLGGDFWRSTAIHLPKDAPAQWVNIITGRHSAALAVGKEKVLPMQALFKEFPVALLFSAIEFEEPALQEERTGAASCEHF
jgi:(1->4)-alpha-D-glucan 1-alpha-D-glucosylmutase